EAGKRIEGARDVEVVGDDQQVVVRRERARHFLGRGADVDEQRALVGDQRRRARADRALLLGGDEAARLIGGILDARGDAGAAVKAAEQALLAKIVETLADGLRRHIELSGKAVDADPPLDTSQRQYFLLPGRSGLHAGEFYAGRLPAQASGRGRQVAG